MDSCTLTAEVTGRQHLRSATERKLVVPRYRLNSFGRRRFSVAGQSTWNSLPDSLRDPELSLDTFNRQLKTYIFAKYWWQNVFSALEIFLSMRYINLHFTLLYLRNTLCEHTVMSLRGLSIRMSCGNLSPGLVCPNMRRSREKTTRRARLASCDVNATLRLISASTLQHAHIEHQLSFFSGKKCLCYFSFSLQQFFDNL